MNTSKIIKSSLLGLIGILDILIFADNLMGVYLFTVEPDDVIPMSFFYIPLIFSAVMLGAAIASITRVCKEKSYAALSGFLIQLWLAWMMFACLMISVDLPEVFVLLAVIGFFALGVALYVRRHLKKEPNAPAVSQEPFKTFQMEKAEYCWDAAAKEYCSLHGIEQENLTDEDNEKIYSYSGMRLGYFMAWVIKHDLQSLEFTRIYGHERINDVKSGKITPDKLIADLDYRLSRSDFSEKIIFFIDHYFQYAYFEDYLEIVSGSSVTYCVDYSDEIRDKLEEKLNDRYYDYEITCEEYEMVEIYRTPTEHTVYWRFMNTELELTVSKGVSEEYVNKCTEHLNALSERTIDKLCELLYDEALNNDYVSEDLGDRRKCLEYYRPDRIIIYRPYGEEPAYCIGGEADFEEEHGIGICIRGDQIVMISYRTDVEFSSPWSKRLEAEYQKLKEQA